ncbi:MAG: NAD-dependent epimerase/dehydratase family protein [Dehalococcoidia bacterium]|nr:NAD-dependent epimerase/dehydratase family protein [Dehalococcoidia bacterium]
MSRNLVTGGLGYIGSNLSRRLLADGEEVVIFDILPGSPSIEDIKNDVKLVRGELGNFAEVLNAVHANGIDCIYHLGAMITMPAEADPWAAYGTNANGTYHVLEAARLFHVGSVIFPSGIATYGPGAPEVVNEDVFQSNPSQIYAATKIFGERLGEYYHHRFGVNFRCPSFPAICGPGRRQGLAAYASLMVHDPARGRLCKLPIDEAGQMPFIYIKDVVRCLVSLRDVDESRLHRRVYTIGGFSLPAREMADAVRRYVPDARIEFLADETVVKLVRGMPTRVDDSRARQDWGWSPEYDWDRTVQDFMVELEAHPDLYG